MNGCKGMMVYLKDIVCFLKVRTIRVEKRVNDIVNRLNKTKVERTPDLRGKSLGCGLFLKVPIDKDHAYIFLVITIFLHMKWLLAFSVSLNLKYIKSYGCFIMKLRGKQ